LSKRRGSMGMNTLQGWGVRRPTKNMFHGTFMMSLFQIAGHVFSSMAIARVPVSTVHTIKVSFRLLPATQV
jgi:solute carrier family 35 protein E1